MGFHYNQSESDLYFYIRNIEAGFTILDNRFNLYVRLENSKQLLGITKIGYKYW